MIIDCHTHIWADPAQMGRAGESALRRAARGQAPSAKPADHSQAAKCVAKTLVFAYRSAAAGALVPNSYVAEYVSSNGAMLGVAAVDPADRASVDEADTLLDDKRFCGLTLDPVGGDFHPCDTRAWAVYELSAARGKPVFIGHGRHLTAAGKMEYGRPSLLEEIARAFPNLTIVVASMGWPWVAECIALAAQCERVYTDIAPLLGSPWATYNALVAAHECGIMDKVLFGSDFPCRTPAQAIEAIYRLREVTQGTNLPTLPREALRSMVERGGASALGFAAEEAKRPAAASETSEEEVHWRA